MFKKKTAWKRNKLQLGRGSRLALEPLEDRCVPHSGVVQFTAGITANAAPAGIVLGPDGNFWFTEFDASKIARITKSGVVTEFSLSPGRGPLNITFDPRDPNGVYFTENLGDRIGKLNALAGSDASIQASIVEFSVPGSGSAPNDIAFGPDGALWFTQSGSDQIGRITTAGVITEFAVPGTGSAPAGITAGADGALWFTESGSGQIGRISTAGVVTEFLIPAPVNAVSDPEDITSGPGGDLFFTDFGRDQISRITTAGVITQYNLKAGRGPHNIVAAPDGNLYFTEAASGRIGKIPAGAIAPGKPTSGALSLEEFDFIPAASVPLGIALDGSDDIYFTLNAGNAIGTFEAHLTQLTVTATGSTVNVFDIHMNPVRKFTAFPGFTGSVSVAVQDFAGTHGIGNGNGVPDIIVAAGKGGGPHVQVLDGSDNNLLANFFAFDPSVTTGLSLGSDDVNGDGRADILVSANGHLKVIDGLKIGMVQSNGQISDSALLASFFPFGTSFQGSLSIAAGDINRDGKADLVIGAGKGGGPHVKVVNATQLNLVQADGQIPDSALLGNFFAFDPDFRGGVSVGVGINGDRRDVIVGAGSGGGSHVKVINGTLLSQVLTTGQISDTALVGSFFAFGLGFQGGVQVSADDLNNDGLADLILVAGPGGGPHIKVVDGAKLSQTKSTGEIDDGALLRNFFIGDPRFRGGVQVAADADHRDGPTFGPPGITINSSRRDINDVFIFQSPANPANTVLTMTVSPFSTGTTPNVFVEGLGYEFRVANRDILNTTDDLTFRANFGPADSLGVQDAVIRAFPATKFPGSGGVLVKSLTKQNASVRGVGGAGTAQFRAAEQDDPFFFDGGGFNGLINRATAVDGVLAGIFPRGTANSFDAPNFFGPSANTLALTLEIPSSRLTSNSSNVVALWGRTEVDGVQLDRMGRPAINVALIPPLPRGSNFPIGGTTDPNRQDRRNAFNAGHPRNDRADFTADMVSVLTAFYPAGRPGGVPNPTQAGVVAGLLLPDILVIDLSSNAGFGGGLPTSGGNTFLGNGRKLSDDVVSTELSVLTDDDLPAAFGGGANLPALTSQNVKDDNGLNLKDGSIDPPSPRGTTGLQREAVFPYIGAPNATPTPVPGTQPPP